MSAAISITSRVPQHIFLVALFAVANNFTWCVDHEGCGELLGRSNTATLEIAALRFARPQLVYGCR